MTLCNPCVLAEVYDKMGEQINTGVVVDDNIHNGNFKSVASDDDLDKEQG